jgi:multicomponent Na+:H+ antiporter subunit F
MIVLSAAFLLSLLRVIRGPTLPDRVVAMDLASTTAVILLGAYAVVTGEAALLDAAIVVALVGFLAVVAVASYIQRGGQR